MCIGGSGRRREYYIRAINNGTHPKSAVAGGNAGGENGKDEFNILTRQWTQIKIQRIVLTFIPFADGAPECLDRGANLVIETKIDIAVYRAEFTGHGRAEAIPVLNVDRWIEALDISVLNVLWESEKAGT